MLFLQGPISPFFSDLAMTLKARGYRVLRVNFCFGDRLFWHHPGALNYAGRRSDWPSFIAALLDREQVTDLILLGEQRTHHKAAIAAAQARAVTVMVTDFGYLRPDWITFERDGMSANSHFPRDAEAIRALARHLPPAELDERYADSFLRQAIWDVLYHLSACLLWFMHPHYRSHHLYHPILFYLGLGRRLLTRRWANRAADRVIDAVSGDATPYFVFPMQMESDFQLRAYSRFRSQTEAIEEIVDSFARGAPPTARLIVKIHPLDPGLRNWRRRVAAAARRCDVAERVIYIDGGSIHRLLRAARGVITINSTVGVWALRANLPVVALGSAVYAVDGLTFSGPLDRFWTEAIPPDAGLLADFLRAIVGTIQIRGVYYARPGLDVAVREAADRLDALQPLPVTVPPEAVRSERIVTEVAAVIDPSRNRLRPGFVGPSAEIEYGQALRVETESAQA